MTCGVLISTDQTSEKYPQTFPWEMRKPVTTAWWVKTICVSSERATQRSTRPIVNDASPGHRVRERQGTGLLLQARERGRGLTVRGEDFLVTGSRSDKEKLRHNLGSKHDMKTQVLVREHDCRQEVESMRSMIR